MANNLELIGAMSDLNCLFTQMASKKFSFSLMSRVARKFGAGGAAANVVLPYGLYNDALNHLVSARFEIDYRVVIHFLPTFKTIFLHLSFDDWQRAMDHFFKIKELRQTHRGFPREEMYTLAYSYSLAIVGSANFDAETENAAEFLFRDYGPFSNLIDESFEANCRQLSFLMLLEKALIDKIVSKVLKDRTEIAMLNFVKFTKCTPGLMKCAPPVALYRQIRETIDTGRRTDVMIARLKFGLTATCDNIGRIETIGESSFCVVKNCGPLFSKEEELQFLRDT